MTFGKNSTRIGIKAPPLSLILDFYDAVLRTDDMGKIAAALQTRPVTLATWIKKHPEFKLAKELAEKRRGSTQSFSGYIFKHLSPEAKKVWEEVQFWDESSSYEKIEAVLQGQTKRIRQELFIHALVSSSFDVSEALRMVSLSRKTYDHWGATDLEFRQLIEEIQWHKKNFFEAALMDLVEERHPTAVLFVNRTVNADRGYNEKLEVQHTGVDGGFGLEDLDLDLETRKKILDAIRRKKATVLDVVANAKPVREAALGEGEEPEE